MMRAAFKDRRDAGKQLAGRLTGVDRDAIVLAIPRGGVPVGYEVAKRLDAPLDIIVPRKLPIPWNTEAGFGAVTPDGTMVLNDDMVARLGLTAYEIREISEEVLAEVRRRVMEYRGDRPYPDVKGKTVIVVDDGLASGYTMIAAVRSIKNKSPSKVIVAVPVSPADSARRLRKEADEVVCLIEQPYGAFAVASYYREWVDLTDEEVKAYLDGMPAR